MISTAGTYRFTLRYQVQSWSSSLFVKPSAAVAMAVKLSARVKSEQLQIYNSKFKSIFFDNRSLVYESRDMQAFHI